MGNAHSAGLRLQTSNKIHIDDQSNKESNAKNHHRRSVSLNEKFNPDDSQNQFFLPRFPIDRKQTNLNDQTLNNMFESYPQSNLIDMEMSSKDISPISERCQNTDPKSSELLEKRQSNSSSKSPKKLALNLISNGSKNKRISLPDRTSGGSIAEEPHIEEIHSEVDEHPSTVNYTNEDGNKILEAPLEDKVLQLDDLKSYGAEDSELSIYQIEELQELTGDDELSKIIKETIATQTKRFGVFSYQKSEEEQNNSFRPPCKDPNSEKVYYGEWKDDKKHGKGCMIWPDGSIYQGHWVNDMRNGKGRYITIKGNMYEGEWKNDKLHGKGKCTYASGSVYDGEWIADSKNGYGCETYSDKTKYEGYFENNLKKGRGRQQWPDGSVYTGDFLDNAMNGTGTLQWADGRNYTGEWKNDKMHGKGAFCWPDGRKFVGSYKEDMKDGYGEFEWPDRNKYKGSFVSNKMHGEGLYISSNGKVRAGIWKDGKIARWS